MQHDWIWLFCHLCWFSYYDDAIINKYIFFLCFSDYLIQLQPTDSKSVLHSLQYWTGVGTAAYLYTGSRYGELWESCFFWLGILLSAHSLKRGRKDFSGGARRVQTVDYKPWPARCRFNTLGACCHLKGLYGCVAPWPRPTFYCGWGWCSFVQPPFRPSNTLWSPPIMGNCGEWRFHYPMRF